MEFKTLIAEEKDDSFDYSDKYNSLKFDKKFDEKEVVRLIKDYDCYVAYIDDGDTYRRKQDDNTEIVAKLLNMGCTEYIIKDVEADGGRKYDKTVIGTKK
jgi:hypothetical protein